MQQVNPRTDATRSAVSFLLACMLIARCAQQAPVVLFMKGNPDTPRCGFSNTTTKILREAGVPFKSFDILQDEAVRQRALGPRLYQQQTSCMLIIVVFRYARQT